MSKSNKNSKTFDKGKEAKGTNGKNNSRYNSKSRSDNYDERDNRNTRGGRKGMSTNRWGNGYSGCENDPAWYNKLNTLIHDVTNIPFGYQVGRQLDYKNAVNAGEDPYNTTPPPGVLSIPTFICPGIATSATDGVNIAATGIFQNIRKHLSTVATYAPADVMMNILAVDSLVTLYNVILRNFGMINLYSSLNYNYNKSLYVAQGWSERDIIDFYEHFSDYRTRFNQLIYKASTIFMPAKFPITDRHAWLFSNVFIDSVSPKAQIYMHMCPGVYTLDEETSSEGTQLTWASLVINSTPMMQNLLDIFAEMIERLRNSDSMNKISADMAKAFEGSSSWQFAYCDEGYTINPLYSKEVLSQIENAVILPNPDMDTLNITQSVNKNIILYQPEFKSQTIFEDDIGAIDFSAWNDNLVINMHWDNPSSDDIAVATRDMVVLEHSLTTHTSTMKSCGSDWMTYPSIIRATTEGAISAHSISRFMALTGALTASQQAADELFLWPEKLRDYVSFDWAPGIHACQATSDTLNTANPHLFDANLMIDYDNFTMISSDLLNRIHNNVITSMWNVPQLGDVVSS